MWQVAAVLVALTVGSAAISGEQDIAGPGTIAIFCVAALKAELLLSHFMEAAAAERQWQWLYRLWIAAVTGLLAIGLSL